MSYQGTERRAVEHIICNKEKDIQAISIDVSEVKGDVKALGIRINGSLDKIATHIMEGDNWRKLIVGTAISLILAIIGGVSTTWIVTSNLSFNLGTYAKQIMVNTERLSNIEAVVHGKRNRV